jgi:hypothetical protein
VTREGHVTYLPFRCEPHLAMLKAVTDLALAFRQPNRSTGRRLHAHCRLPHTNFAFPL